MLDKRIRDIEYNNRDFALGIFSKYTGSLGQ